MSLVLPLPRNDGKPGEYFTWDEMTVTSTGLENRPTALHRNNLRLVCHHVLDPLRRALGAIRVTSGFRSIAVNTKIGGSKHSAHMKGMAADFKSWNGDFNIWDIARKVDAHDIPFDQCILYPRGENGGWVHIGLKLGKMRRQWLLKPADGGYEPLSLEQVWGIDRL
jgi:putative chitinase